MTSPAETTAAREIRAQYMENIRLGEGSNAAGGIGNIRLETGTTYYVGHAYVVNASNQAVVVSTSQAAFESGIFEGVNFEGQDAVVGDSSTTYTTLTKYRGFIAKNATSTSTITAIGGLCYWENGEYVGNTASTFPIAGKVLALFGGAGGDVVVDMMSRTA